VLGLGYFHRPPGRKKRAAPELQKDRRLEDERRSRQLAHHLMTLLELFNDSTVSMKKRIGLAKEFTSLAEWKLIQLRSGRAAEDDQH
jgi:hypothetical protein